MLLKNIIKFIKENKLLTIELFVLFIVVLGIIVSYIPDKKNTKQDNTDINDSVSNTNKSNEGYYWISTEDYFYGFDDEDLIIPDTSIAFQFSDDDKCYIATINGETIYYNNQVYKLKEYHGYPIEKQGVWFSKIEECTYQIKDNHIYISPLDDDTTLYNGEYSTDKDKIEIIWNGEHKKTTYNNIKIKNDILFGYEYILGYDDIYEYEIFDYDVDSHIREPNIGIDYGIGIDEIIKPILLEQNLDISIDEFWSFNERMLDFDSLEYQAFFNGGLYNYNSYATIGLRSKGIEQVRGKVLKLYAPKRKLSKDEVIDKISKETNIAKENIVVPDKLDFQGHANVYITSMDVLKDYLY